MNSRFYSLLGLTLALGISACKEPTQFVGGIDGGLTCGENERLVDGECIFVCDRDGDCAAGERCNLLRGTCEPKAPTVDAGAVKIPCTEGADRCSSNAKTVETCSAGGTWSVKEVCPMPTGYCQDERCLFCQPASAQCAAGTPSKQVQICANNGSAFRTVACSASATCTQGECRECTPGATRCSPDGKSVQTCSRQANEAATFTWSNSGDAFDGSCITQVCEAVPSGGAQCKAPECLPGATQCQSTSVQQTCNATGSWVSSPCTTVGPRAECQNGVCFDECADAEKSKSYFGCDYWTAIQDNVVDARLFKGNVKTGQGALGNDSNFAFVLANRSTSPASVTITRHFGGSVQVVKQEMLPGRTDPATKGLKVFKVPWQSVGSFATGGEVSQSGLLRYAYRIESTKPVTVYQFNPLDAATRTGTCTSASNCTLGSNPKCIAGTCEYYSYTNDASLLLPAHILGTSYVAMAPEYIARRAGSTTGATTNNFNAHLTIVASKDATSVTVKTTAKVRAGTGVTAFDRGASRTYTLNTYDVLQLASDVPTTVTNVQCVTDPYQDAFTCALLSCDQFCRVQNSDLTGSIITADKPIAVFGGSACTTRGVANVACDHVEEQLFPFSTWGKAFVAGRSAPLKLTNGQYADATNAGPDYYKIVAGCGAMDCAMGTLVTLSAAPSAGDLLTAPAACNAAALAGGTCRLLAGEFIEFRSKTSFTITADNPIMVGQFFASQSATTGGSAPVQGDPSFVLLPPIEQWRPTYTVLAAPGTNDNYIGLIWDSARVDEVSVDDVPVTGAVSVGSTTYRIVNAKATTGTHTISVKSKPGQNPVPGAGVTVYGFDSYVSYGYTGGLDLSTLVTGITPGG